MKVWLKGFAAALIGGAVSGVAQVAAGGSLQLGKIKGSVIAGALLTVAAYLTKSPVSDSAPPATPKE